MGRSPKTLKKAVVEMKSLIFVFETCLGFVSLDWPVQFITRVTKVVVHHNKLLTQ